MISFRYHLVSLVAVFLALALGIVVGTTALNGPITTDLRKQVNSLKGDRTTLANEVKVLQAQVNDNEQFAATFGAQLVAGTLPKQPVLIVGLPGAGSSVQDAIAQQIAAAGGVVTGRVQLTNDYVDPRRGTDIATLATGPAHPIGLTLPETSDPGQLGGALLAYVLTGSGTATDTRQVLAGFQGLHMVSGSTTITASKTIIVVGTGALALNGYPAAVELAFVNALVKAGAGVLVAGDPASATAGGIVALVRNIGSDRSTVSSVDNADTALGQVSTVLAVADLVQSKSVGHYGTQPGADSLFPNPSTK